MIGRHFIKTWSKAQHVVSLSSAEAELYAAVRAASELIGLRSLMHDLGMRSTVALAMDATAAISMMKREGLGLAKHISTQWLWVQERVKMKDFAIRKVGTKMNPADLFTKQLPERDMVGHLSRMGCNSLYENVDRRKKA